MASSLALSVLSSGSLWFSPLASAADPPPDQERPSKGQVLYYRNPMGLPDTSPVPKKDPMGMDYLPVYADEAGAAGQVVLTPEKIQKLGVRTEPVRRMALAQTVRAVGLLTLDERREVVVAPRFEGWIERLYVSITGQTVRRGEPLAGVYSPELVSAHYEYRLALSAGLSDLAEAALDRLRNWQVPKDQIEQFRRTRDHDPGMVILLRAPADGVVMEKKAVLGMRFMPGEELYRLADLSKLWLHAEVFERDLPLVRIGQAARITVNAYPGEIFTGAVTFIYPTFEAQTRTVKVRVELANPGGRLKPAMYASVEFAPDSDGHPVLVIPASAVLESGARQVALVEIAEGRFEPRELKLGRRGEGMVEVRDGLREGERVVVAANFLIDAESNLKAALGAFGHSAHGSQPSAPATEAPAGTVAPAAPDHAGH
ncbi:MAG: efflux RND transporter periplasmic adaptor subunit [Candidatus Competibacter sp.]|nr:efflux RND transporter periplasmic adaptor subunit [Candidatus Competibacter sp.]